MGEESRDPSLASCRVSAVPVRSRSVHHDGLSSGWRCLLLPVETGAAVQGLPSVPPVSCTRLCHRPEADQQQGPPVQLRCQLTQDQAEAGGADGRKHGQQHGQGLAGGHLPFEAQHLPFGIAPSWLQPRFSNQVLIPLRTVMGGCGDITSTTVVRSCSLRAERTPNQWPAEQSAGGWIESCRHDVLMTFILLSLAQAQCSVQGEPMASSQLRQGCISRSASLRASD